MGNVIRITESGLQKVIRNIVEQNIEINEIHGKGFWKPVWTEDDQILALYNSLYGVSRLGISRKDIATKIIGSSPDSFIKQTSNFDFLNGRSGLRRNKTEIGKV